MPFGIGGENGGTYMFYGIGASDGIGIGRAVKISVENRSYSMTRTIDAEAEKKRLDGGIGRFAERTERLAARMDESGADGAILRGHIAMMSDPYMISQMRDEIDSGASAEAAVIHVCDSFIAMFSETDDDMTRERCADIEDTKREVLAALTGAESTDISSLPVDSVIITDELTPSMTAEMDRSHVAAIVTERGGMTSHSAIISRSLGIPAVLSVLGALNQIEDGEPIIVDGRRGEVLCGFDAETAEHYRGLAKMYEAERKCLEEYRGKPSKTADGVRVAVYANVGTVSDIDSAVSGDAEGIGLFRTEFLFLDRTVPPTEDEQYASYNKAALAMKGREVIIRTLDVGGDKNVPCLGMKHEDNPFLGHRAIRYCLSNRELFKTQLRAVLRASADGKVALMLPLVTRLSEVRDARSLLHEAMRELEADGVPYDRDIRFGVMIETPAACMIADCLAAEVDFFSIGTNDLTGYIMAADRGNAEVGEIYSVFDPAVLRAVRRIISCAGAAGIMCGMCGEAAADERLIPLLVAFGLGEYSVNPGSVLRVRRTLSDITRADAERIAEAALSLDTEREVREYLDSCVRKEI